MISKQFKLYKAFDPFFKAASSFIDPKWGTFANVAKKTLLDNEKKEEEKLTTKGFLQKYGVDSEDYDDLKWRRTSSMKNVSQWRWTDARLENAIRKLTATTNNAHFTRMLQKQSRPVPPISRKGVRTSIPSTKTKFG